MGSQQITLTQHTLGLSPYVLVEFFDGGDGDDDLRANVSAGGGIGSVADIRSALDLALSSLPDHEPGSEAATSGSEAEA